jgi:hypothetical protein
MGMPLAAENTTMIIALVASGVLIWLFCAYSAAAFARANGQSYNAWIVIGLMGGPITLAFAYLYFRTTGERHRRKRHGEGHRYDLPEIVRCNNCGQSVPSSFPQCQFCGAPLHRRTKRR